MSSFADLNLHERLVKALGELEITTPTPVQTAAIPAALEGRDLRVVARTGSGKPPHSCCPCCISCSSIPARVPIPAP